MPEQLLARIIRASSHPQDLVMDPFGGSGTTMCVAKKLGRQWMGLELSADYAKSIKERLKKANVGDPIDGPEDPIESAPSTAKGKQRKSCRKISVEIRTGNASESIVELSLVDSRLRITEQPDMTGSQAGLV